MAAVPLEEWTRSLVLPTMPLMISRFLSSCIIGPVLLGASLAFARVATVGLDLPE